MHILRDRYKKNRNSTLKFSFLKNKKKKDKYEIEQVCCERLKKKKKNGFGGIIRFTDTKQNAFFEGSLATSVKKTGNKLESCQL